MAHDPLEMHDLAAERPEIVAKLKGEYDAWFNDVTGARDYAVPSRIFLGAPQENPVLLTRQDWRGGQADWTPKGIGYWEVKVVTGPRLTRSKFSSMSLQGGCGGFPGVWHPFRERADQSRRDGVYFPQCPPSGGPGAFRTADRPRQDGARGEVCGDQATRLELSLPTTHMKRFLTLLAALLTPLVALPAAETKPAPNVLLIILEDWGPYLGCYGQKEMFTPNLDKLASEGCVYRNCFFDGLRFVRPVVPRS